VLEEELRIELPEDASVDDVLARILDQDRP